MGNRPTNNSRPSAEKTPANSVIIQLKNSVKKAFHPSATEKDRTLTNGMAAIYFEQSRFLNRLGRFSMDEPGMDDPEQGQVILDDAQSVSDGESVTTGHRIPSVLSPNEVPILSSTSSNASIPRGGTRIASPASVKKALPCLPMTQQPLQAIFPHNVAKPFFRTSLPEPGNRFDSTFQLAFCHHLLPKKPSTSLSIPRLLVAVGDDTQAAVFTEAEQEWMVSIAKDSFEQKRIRELAAQVVSEFHKRFRVDAESIVEIVILGSVIDPKDHRRVLSALIGHFERDSLLDLDAIHGIVQLLQSAKPGYLIDDDLTSIMRILQERLERTYKQLGDANQPASIHIYQLTTAVSRVLDAMVEGNIKGLDRTKDYRPLLEILTGLERSPDPYLKFQASYACQALQYIGDDEPPLHAVLRFGGGVAIATLGAAAVFKLDPENLFNGLRELCVAAGQGVDFVKAGIEGVEALRAGGEGAMDSLLKGFRSGARRAWYPALQGARVLIREGQLAKFRRVVYEAPFCHQREFQWGVCQLLGEIAMDPVWVTKVRQQAVEFLGRLYKDAGWKQHSDVNEWILAILTALTQLNRSTDEAVMDHARFALQDLTKGGTTITTTTATTTIATVMVTLWSLFHLHRQEFSPLLAGVQPIPDVEYNLKRLKDRALQERRPDIYIPPQAKASLQSQDDDIFPLDKKAHGFMVSESAKVLLLLGDSGSGKSTFGQHLEHQLWYEYQQGGIIPLRIILSAIDKPDEDMIRKHLESNDFTTEQIMELKQREFILICDGYDEIRQRLNLYETNRLNKPGHWRGRMIVTCRSQYLGHDYRILFQPPPSTSYGQALPEQFQQAVIAPFSPNQIEDYVEQYVDFQCRLSTEHQPWSATDYMDKLRKIPNLMDLVKNPFLLTLSLQALPAVVGTKTDLLSIQVTRVILYDEFMKSWLQSNKQRIQSHIQRRSREEQEEFEAMLDRDFVQEGTEFLKDLSAYIYEKQPGNTVIIYPSTTRNRHGNEDDSWKERFFGSGARIKLLREASPLTRSGKQYQLIHASLLEYFYSLQFYDPYDFGDQPRDAPTFDCLLLSNDNSLLGQRDIVNERTIVQFLADRARVDSFFEQQLKAMIGRSETDPNTIQAKKNAVIIFVEGGIRYRGLDLKAMPVLERLNRFGV